MQVFVSKPLQLEHSQKVRPGVTTSSWITKTHPTGCLQHLLYRWKVLGIHCFRKCQQTKLRVKLWNGRSENVLLDAQQACACGTDQVCDCYRNSMACHTVVYQWEYQTLCVFDGLSEGQSQSGFEVPIRWKEKDDCLSKRGCENLIAQFDTAYQICCLSIAGPSGCNC